MGIAIDVVGRGAGDLPDAVLVAVFGVSIAGPFEPREGQLPVLIERQRFSFGDGVAAFVAAPAPDGGWCRARRDGAVGPMFNGRFVWASGGRFGEALGEGAFARPVKLMDRWETPAEYATYD